MSKDLPHLKPEFKRYKATRKIGCRLTTRLFQVDQTYNPFTHLDKQDLPIIMAPSTTLPSITKLEVYKENNLISNLKLD